MDDGLTIRIQGPNAAWQTIGAGISPGIVPENVELNTNEWGSDTASFDLHRLPGGQFPDLFARSAVEVEIAGTIVWSGRLKETPSRDGEDPVINVQARGWQYHLDDDAYSKNYVHTSLDDFRDNRSFTNTSLANKPQICQVQVGNGIIQLGDPKGGDFPAGTIYSAVTLDLGASNTAQRVVINYDSNSLSAAYTLLVYGHSNEDPTAGAATAITVNNPTSGTVAGNFGGSFRYVSILLQFTIGAAGTFGNDEWVRIKSAQVFGSTAYESGNVSILKADTIIKDALTHATKLSSDQTLIAAGGFSIPEFVIATTDPKTPREAWDAANLFHDYKSQIDTSGRPVWQPRSTAASYEIGTWAGAMFEDSSMNSDEEVYNKVIVTGTGPDGAPVVVTRTTVAPLLARNGETNTKILQISSPLTVAVANQLGDIWLAGHKTTPLKGTVTVTGIGGIRRVLGGMPVHPAEMLLRGSELLRLSHRLDPDTGALGRDGKVVGVKYVHDGRRAEIKLDNDRSSFEAFIQRLSVVTGSALGN